MVRTADVFVRPEERMRVIGTQALRVAKEAEEHGNAIRRERGLEAQILAQAIEQVRPALKALANRLHQSYEIVRDQQGEIVGSQVQGFTPHAERGFALAGDREVVSVNHAPKTASPHSFHGRFEGRGLVLLESGALAERVWVGAWSNCSNTRSSWTSTLTVVTPEQAMDDWDLEDCLSSILGALCAQQRAKATQKAEERIARLQAVLTLVK